MKGNYINKLLSIYQIGMKAFGKYMETLMSGTILHRFLWCEASSFISQSLRHHEITLQALQGREWLWLKKKWEEDSYLRLIP